MSASSTILALDVGERRIGVARATTDTRWPAPLKTLTNDATILDQLRALLTEEQVSQLIIGLPRGLDGQETSQTQAVRAFADQVAHTCGIEPVLQDEALTSQKAETELKNRGKTYDKAEVDALAATYILEDYLRETEHQA